MKSVRLLPMHQSTVTQHPDISYLNTPPCCDDSGKLLFDNPILPYSTHAPINCKLVAWVSSLYLRLVLVPSTLITVQRIIRIFVTFNFRVRVRHKLCRTFFLERISSFLVPRSSRYLVLLHHGPQPGELCLGQVLGQSITWLILRHAVVECK